jgi:hypothetical protein
MQSPRFVLVFSLQEVDQVGTWSTYYYIEDDRRISRSSFFVLMLLKNKTVFLITLL